MHAEGCSAPRNSYRERKLPSTRCKSILPQALELSDLRREDTGSDLWSSTRSLNFQSHAMDFESLKSQVSNLTLYDIKAGVRKVQNGTSMSGMCLWIHSADICGSCHEPDRDGINGPRSHKRRPVGCSQYVRSQKGSKARNADAS